MIINPKVNDAILRLKHNYVLAGLWPKLRKRLF